MASPGEQPKPLTPKQKQAAILLAEDELTDQAIADELKVTRRTLATWKHIPAFRELVDGYISDLEDLARRRSYGRRDRRMSRYYKRLDAIDTLIAERGAEMAGEVAGAETGLLLRIPKTVKHTYEPHPDEEDGEVITAMIETNEYREATQLLKEERELLKQVSIEAGQWVEKEESTGTLTTSIAIVGVDVEAI